MESSLLTGLIPYAIPSPPISGFQLGPLTIRFYALSILAGIVAGYLITRRRWIARGGNPDTLESALVVAIPLGIVGARVYHVITDYQLYFCDGCNPVTALYIWNGGLGIWGAVAFGVLGAYLVVRRRGVRFFALADAAAPGFLVAQAIGRLGNWFNQELYGAPTDLPWAIAIDPAHRLPGLETVGTYHPTFLYELLWNLGAAAVLIWADRRFGLGRGKVFALYVVLYTAGRFWIEALRIDTVNTVGGFRLNNYTSAIVFVLALAWLVWLIRRRPGREHDVDPTVAESAPARAADDPADADADDRTDDEIAESDDTPAAARAADSEEVPPADRDPR